MRTILIIVAFVTLGLGNEAFAQAAPKEVIVVDGQLAANNGPLNPASVMVENGIINPVPVIDLTPQAGEPFVWQINAIQDPTTNTISAEILLPVGKVLKLVGLSARVTGNQDSEFSFQLSDVSYALVLPGEFDTVHLGASHNFLSGGGRSGMIFIELNDFPLLRQVRLRGNRARPNNASHTSPIELNGQVWGYLIDDPAL